MAEMVLMPQKGVSDESAVLAQWLVKEGDTVKKDQIIFTQETGKSSYECEAPADGVILKIFVAEGEEVNVGVPVCAIGQAGETVNAPAAGAAAAPVAEAAPAAPAAPVAAAPAAAPAGPTAAMVLMPQKGVSDESAVLAQWLVKEGDTVKKDQIIFTQETGKSSYECESPADGVVLKIFVSEGEEVNVGVPVCAIGQPGDAIAAPVAGAAAPAEAAAAPVAAAPVAAAPAAATASADGFKASPRAKMLAADTGVDVKLATPTGPNGRIIERDVKTLLKNGVPAAAPAAKAEAPAAAAPVAKAEAPAAAPAPAAAYEDKPLSKIRKVIAANMHKSLSEMAQLTLNRTFDATAIMEYRKLAKASKGMGVEDLTLNDFILYAVARTLPEFPELNAHYLGDKMRYFNGVQLGVAVDTPRGLLVPVIANADKMSLVEISKAVKEKAAQCKDGSIPANELTGGSFTVSNLGAAGIESFTPVINPPQTGILGVDTFTLRAKEVNGEIKYYKAMGLSLTFDHRALDGAPAANFLKALAEKLENFSLLLAK